MRKALFGSVAALGCVVLLAGCGEYNKLLKSKDYELMYAKALEYYEAGRYSRTVQLFEEIGYYYNGTSKEDTITFFTGAAYYKQGDFESSGMVFDYFRQTYGRSPFLEEAEYMYAKGYYYVSPLPNRDQNATMVAIRAINEYIDRYPNSVKREALEENLVELKGRLMDKSYINAKEYYKIGRYKAAVVALKNSINYYPESPHREEMMYLVAKSAYYLADNSVPSLKKDRYLNMMDYYYNFISEYPDSRYVRELDKMQEAAKKFVATEQEEDTEEITETGYGS